MKISIAQFAVKRGDATANLARISELSEEAASFGAEILCLPEMCTTGFDWSSNREQLADASSSIAELKDIAQEHGIAICGSFLEKTELGNAANCFHYIDAKGSLLARYRKMHLFTLFHEECHVEAGNQCVVFDTAYGKMGASICYDLRFPELFRQNTKAGALLHILPAAFPHPRLEHWRKLICARAIENQTYFIAANQSGVEDHGSGVGETHYFGHSMVVDPGGVIVAEANEDECLLQVEIDLSNVSRVRKELSAWDDRRTDIFD
jgi:predicted amidohydrolase